MQINFNISKTIDISLNANPFLSLPHQDAYSQPYQDDSGGYTDEHGVTRGIVGQCTQSTFDYNHPLKYKRGMMRQITKQINLHHDYLDLKTKIGLDG